MRLLSLLATATTLLMQPAIAQEIQNTPTLELELNALQQAQSSCRITFLANNKLGATLDRAAYEIALFDKSGTISQLVTLDFKSLTIGKSKVLQFDLPALSCDQLGRVLINDASACEGAQVPATACLEQLSTRRNVDVEFGI